MVNQNLLKITVLELNDSSKKKFWTVGMVKPQQNLSETSEALNHSSTKNSSSRPFNKYNNIQ